MSFVGSPLLLLLLPLLLLSISCSSCCCGKRRSNFATAPTISNANFYFDAFLVGSRYEYDFTFHIIPKLPDPQLRGLLLLFEVLFPLTLAMKTSQRSPILPLASALTASAFLATCTDGSINFENFMFLSLSKFVKPIIFFLLKVHLRMMLRAIKDH